MGSRERPDPRASAILAARVYLAQCSAHRRDPVWTNAWWIMFAWAQSARRRATISREAPPVQGELF